MLLFNQLLYIALNKDAIIIRKYIAHMVVVRMDMKLFYRFYFYIGILKPNVVKTIL